ncbi:MAG TPA: aminoglycoside phosphotransferase family protein [Jiangellaceae bacterium]|nr:aminoglycoside phosphotransferase family protein [Jiangellaceae bacterium]
MDDRTVADGEPPEVPLTGGNVGGAVRVGRTVRRAAGPWTPAVHALLKHLQAAGLQGVPGVLGLDERAREVLSYLPGRTVDVDAELVADTLLIDAVRWLRRFHNAVAGYRPDGVVRWRNEARALAADEIVCHHDPGAYNWIVEGDRFVGVIDWDMAGPGHPIDDLAFMAWSSVPLFRPIPTPDVARRLELMATTYGELTAEQILTHVDVRMSRACDRIQAGQAAGDPGLLNLGRVGEPARTRARLALLRERMSEIGSALSAGRTQPGSAP